jgi:hypothetical protein
MENQNPHLFSSVNMIGFISVVREILEQWNERMKCRVEVV